MSAPVEAWAVQHCTPCKRERIHYRVEGSVWRCIGRLPDGTSKACGHPLD